MARGMWRWWETKDGADVWWARVEDRPGQWRDVSQAEYARIGLAPPFWDLPLKEEYVEAILEGPDRIDNPQRRASNDFVFSAIVSLMFIFCVVFVIYVVGYALLVQLHVIH